ncbi:MAG: hypothetical protein OXU81_10250 [Gammaproteobacteria bacterium]|nr:hypothetical protein [Gammaproteobacteria bacterium]
MKQGIDSALAKDIGIAVLDQADLVVREAKDRVSPAVADFSRMRDASPAPFTPGRGMKFRDAFHDQLRDTGHADPQ